MGVPDDGAPHPTSRMPSLGTSDGQLKILRFCRLEERLIAHARNRATTAEVLNGTNRTIKGSDIPKQLNIYSEIALVGAPPH